MKNLDAWMEVYAHKLADEVAKHPDDYDYGVMGVMRVCNKMRPAFEKNDYFLESRAIRSTARHFKIDPTRKAIHAFLIGGP